MTPALIFLVQALATQLLLLILFWLRRAHGLAPLYACLGVFQVLQTFLAPVLVEVAPGLRLSTGSAILFTLTLPTILMVYLHESLSEVRKLIYSILFANFVASVLMMVVGFQLRNGLATTAIVELPAALFPQTAQTLAVGTALLFIDSILIPIIYELFSRVLRGVFLRVLIPSLLVLVFDSLIFVLLNFGSDPAFSTILTSSLVGKTIVATLFSALIAVYHHKYESAAVPAEASTGKRNVLAILTYKERIEELSRRAVRDSLTGLYNRTYFDENLDYQITLARETSQPGALLLIDVDKFKSINDQHGHLVGDRVLKEVADAIQSSTRRSDVACRFGGDEFAIILPNVDHDNAIRGAEKILEVVCNRELRDKNVGRIAGCTIGMAFFPGEAVDATAAVGIAEARLHVGKRTGRGRIISEHNESSDT